MDGRGRQCEYVVKERKIESRKKATDAVCHVTGILAKIQMSKLKALDIILTTTDPDPDGWRPARIVCHGYVLLTLTRICRSVRIPTP